MKNLILSLTIAACAVLTVQAEDAKPNRPEGGRGAGRFTPEARVKHMTETLGLTQEQQDKIKKIMEDGRADVEALKDTPQDQRREKMRELMKAQNEKIQAVLTPEQQTKFKAELEAREKQMRDRREKAGEKKEGDAK